VRICLYGGGGKVGSVLAPALEQAGHEVVDGRVVGPAGCDVAVDFTQPDAVLANGADDFAARFLIASGLDWAAPLLGDPSPDR